MEDSGMRDENRSIFLLLSAVFSVRSQAANPLLIHIMIRWQIRTVLLTYILLRFIAWKNEWKHSFTRLFTTLSWVVWSLLEMHSVLQCRGTAGEPTRMRAAPEQVYLPGFEPS